MKRVLQPPSLKSKFQRLEKKDPKSCDVDCGKNKNLI
jgi:hypothetical protein